MKIKSKTIEEYDGAGVTWERDIEWEGKPASLGMLTDITAQNKIDKELRLSEERYRAFVANSSEAIVSNLPEVDQRLGKLWTFNRSRLCVLLM